MFLRSDYGRTFPKMSPPVPWHPRFRAEFFNVFGCFGSVLRPSSLLHTLRFFFCFFPISQRFLFLSAADDEDRCRHLGTMNSPIFSIPSFFFQSLCAVVMDFIEPLTAALHLPSYFSPLMCCDLDMVQVVMPCALGVGEPAALTPALFLLTSFFTSSRDPIMIRPPLSSIPSLLMGPCPSLSCLSVPSLFTPFLPHTIFLSLPSPTLEFLRVSTLSFQRLAGVHPVRSGDQSLSIAPTTTVAF